MTGVWEQMDRISNVIIADGERVAVAPAADRPRRALRRLEQMALVVLQLAGLWTLNFVGVWTVQKRRQSRCPVT